MKGLVIALVAALVATPAPAEAHAPRADGFASLNALGVDGTTGGAAGRTVTVSTQADLERYATAAEPYVIKVRGSIAIEPYGKEIEVASDKSIVGEGAEIVHGGFFLNGVHNVIIRNLTIRDSYVPGDWDGKTKDYDGVQMDGAHHVWIDHNHFTRTGDGLLDIRKDSDYVTVSWNVFSDHNKAVGVGWTPNVVTKVTMHHNWIRGTYQRNGSIDNTEAAHLYNNYVQDTGLYGTMIRGGGRMVVENSYYRGVPDPIVAKDPASQVVQRGNVFDGTRGRTDSAGAAFDPASYYAYRLDPADRVPGIVARGAGPLGGQRPAPRRITVALDGTGDFGSVQAAVGAAPRGAVITVKPGVYREIVRVWPGRRDLTIRGATGDAADVVITYDLPAGGQKFYGGTYGSADSPTFGVLGSGVTVEDITLENSYDESVAPSQALAVRTVGDRIAFEGTRFLGDQDTFKADTPNRDVVSRTYLRDCYIEGDVDFVYGRGTAVLDGCVLKSTGAGYVTAASTSDSNRYGFLIVNSRLESELADKTVHLGRPWHPGNDPKAIAQVVIRDSWLGPHIKDDAWTDMGGFSWRDARLAEYRNTGPGAAVTADRPQLTDDQAADHTIDRYLGGWRP
ncbi:pectinesterase [Nonomuraea solani]|uniref:Pectinesterase n=1 Tax=Nonomuraea solani TaxID=1144553 RepID=A0A1H6ELX9_9ACTN|nr:pectinesterase family protein [Nonomuraea solani]SEG98026.1 pectinesterase [Nonomuraea solani]